MTILSEEQEIPQVTASERVFDGVKLAVRIDTLTYTNGASHRYEAVEYGNAAVLVPVDGDGRLIFVRQYRHAIGEWLLELPAGGIDERDSSPAEAAQRELREETGYRGTLTQIGEMFLAPGYSDEYQYVFIACDLAEDALPADEEEDLRMERLTLDEALARLDAGAIRDAKTIAALLMYVRATAT